MRRTVFGRLMSIFCSVLIALPADLLQNSGAIAAAPVVLDVDNGSLASVKEKLKLFGDRRTYSSTGVSIKVARAYSDPPAESEVTIKCFRDFPRSVARIANVTANCRSLSIETELPLELLLPYDTGRLPDGSSSNDVRVYRLQDIALNGPMAPVESYVDARNKVTIATITEKSGHYFNGLLSPGERPDKAPMTFSGETMSGAGQVDVMRGIPMIQTPSPGIDGDLRLSYPLEFPGTRQGFAPQVSVGYSAQSLVGNIAQGWSLSVPHISVETRWGVPEFDTQLETETYLFNGEQLIPEAGDFLFDPQDENGQAVSPELKDARLAPLNLVPVPHRTNRLRPRKSGQAHFVLRRDEGLWRFVRYGETPTSYWWEAVQESPSGETMRTMYFGKAPGRNGDDVEAVVSPEFSGGKQKLESVLRLGPLTANTTPDAISRWALAREVDGFGNVIDYDWLASCNGASCDAPAQDTLPTDRDLYLKRIIYGGHLQIEETRLRCRENPQLPSCTRRQALYEAQFTWSNSSEMLANARRMDARTGGLTVSRRLLEQVDLRLRRRSLVEVAGSGVQPKFVAAHLNDAKWQCSGSFVQYQFGLERDPLFGKQSGAPAWLRQITKVTPVEPSKSTKIEDGSIFPVGFDVTNPNCARPSEFVKEIKFAEHATRFGYRIPSKAIGNAVAVPFASAAEPVRFSDGGLSLGGVKTGDRIGPLRSLLENTVPDVKGDDGPFAPSMLGSSLTEDHEGGLYLGVGLYVPQKAFSAGPKRTFAQRSKQNELTLLLDVTGDALADLLVNEGGRWVARPGQVSKDGAVSFGTPFDLKLPRGFRFQHEPVYDTKNRGLEAHIFGGMVGGQSGKSTSVQTVYLADMDGDGRVDVVTPSGVFYNPSANGLTKDAGMAVSTPYILAVDDKAAQTGTTPGPVADVPTPDFPKSIENPRYDTVRIWRAPFPGVVRVTGRATAVARNDDPGLIWDRDVEQSLFPPAHRDGVIVAVERSRKSDVKSCAASHLSPAVLDRLDSPAADGPGTWRIHGSRVAEHGANNLEVAHYRLTVKAPQTKALVDKGWNSSIRLSGIHPISAEHVKKALNDALPAWNAANAEYGKFEIDTVGNLVYKAAKAGDEVPPLQLAIQIEPANTTRTGQLALVEADGSGSPGAGNEAVETRFVPREFDPSGATCVDKSTPEIENALKLFQDAATADPDKRAGMFVEVAAGDILYFRTHSIDNGSDDAVLWSPEIQYLDATAPTPAPVTGQPAKLASIDAITASNIDDEMRPISTLCRQNEPQSVCDHFGRNLLRYRPVATSGEHGADPGDLPVLASSDSGFTAPSTGVLRITGGLRKPATQFGAHLELVVIPHQAMDGEIKKIDASSAARAGKEHPLSARLRSCDPVVVRPARVIDTVSRQTEFGPGGDPETVKLTGWRLPLTNLTAGQPSGTIMAPGQGTYSVKDVVKEFETQAACDTRQERRDDPGSCGGAESNEFDVVAGDKICVFVRSESKVSEPSGFWPVDAAAYALVNDNPLGLAYSAALQPQNQKPKDAETPETLPDTECVPPNGDRGLRLPGMGGVRVCQKGREAFYVPPFIEHGRDAGVSVDATNGVPTRREALIRPTFTAALRPNADKEFPKLACDWDAAPKEGVELQERRFVLSVGAQGVSNAYINTNDLPASYGATVASLRTRAIGKAPGGPSRALKVRKFAVFHKVRQDPNDPQSPLIRVARELTAADLAGNLIKTGETEPDLVLEGGAPSLFYQQSQRFVRGQSGTVAVSEFTQPAHDDTDGSTVSENTQQLQSPFVGLSVCAAPDDEIALETVFSEVEPESDVLALDRLLGTAACETLPEPKPGEQNNELADATGALVRGRKNICPLIRSSVQVSEAVQGSDDFTFEVRPLAIVYPVATLAEDADASDMLGPRKRRLNIEPWSGRQTAAAFIGHTPDQHESVEADDIKDPVITKAGKFPIDDVALLKNLDALDNLIRKMQALMNDWRQNAESNSGEISDKIPAFGINVAYRTAEHPKRRQNGAESAPGAKTPAEPVPVDEAARCSWLGRAIFERGAAAMPELARANVATSIEAAPARANWQLLDPKQSGAANAGGFLPFLCAAGPDQLLWTSGSVLSSTRLGIRDLHFGVKAATFVSPSATKRRPVAEPGRNAGIVPPSKHSSTTMSGDFAGFGVSGSKSESTSTTPVEVIDLNGDGFPDIMAGAKTVLTDPFGNARCGAASQWSKARWCRENGLGSAQIAADVRQSTSKTKGASIGFPSAPKTVANGVASARALFAGSSSGQSQDASGAKTQATYFTLNLNADLGSSEETRNRDVIDINGDGLPDLISGDGNLAKLNLGQGFVANDHRLGVSGLIGGRSRSAGLGVSAGVASAFNDNSFEGGLAANVSGGDQRRTLVDINSDGLPDVLDVDGSGNLSAFMNRGDSFATPVSLGKISDGLTALGRTETDRANAGGSYTYTYCISFVVVTVCFHVNPNASVGGVITRQTTVFRDANGDGLPDLIVSDSLLESLKNASGIGISNTSAKVIPNALGQHGLLEHVWQATNSSQLREEANFEFTYSKSNRTERDPNHRWLLAKVIARDGVKADDAGDVRNNARATCFGYSGGYHDRYERRFLGYEKVVTTEGCNASAPSSAVDTGEANTAGIRLIERRFANRTIYESGLLLGETVFDLSKAARAVDASSVARLKRREMRQVFVLMDTALSSHARRICHKIRSELGDEPMDHSLLAVGYVRNVLNDDPAGEATKPEACRDTFLNPTGSDDPVFDHQPRRLTPVLVQTVQQTWEGNSDAHLSSAMQVETDELARPIKACDLGDVSFVAASADKMTPPRVETRGAICSRLSYADYVKPSFAHGATGGGKIIVTQRNKLSRVEVVDHSRAASTSITAAYDEKVDSVGATAPTVRLRTASYDTETGALVKSCQFADTGQASVNPCSGFQHFPRTGDQLKVAANANIAVGSFDYDVFGNLVRYVGPMGSGESFVAKSYRYDPYLTLIEASERTDFCSRDPIDEKAQVKSRECLNTHVASLGDLNSQSLAVDYRHAAPTIVVDINGNRSFVPMDALGRPSAMYVKWTDAVGPPCGNDYFCSTAAEAGLIEPAAVQVASYDYPTTSSNVSGAIAASVTRYSERTLYPNAAGGEAYVGLVTRSMLDQFGSVVQVLSPTESCRFVSPDAMSPECQAANRYTLGPISMTDRLGRSVGEGYPTAITIPRIDLWDRVLQPSIHTSLITYDGLDRPLFVSLPDVPTLQTTLHGAKTRRGNGYDFRYLVEEVEGVLRHRTLVRNAMCVPSAIDRDVRGSIRAVTESSTLTNVEGVQSAALGSAGAIDGSIAPGELQALIAAGLVKAVVAYPPTKPAGHNTDEADDKQNKKSGDASQQVFECVTPAGGEFSLAPNTTTTSYDFDALQQLVAVNLPSRNNNPIPKSASILAAYDGLGRRVAIDDPDRGFERTSFDPLGNATCKYSGSGRGALASADILSDQQSIIAGACADPKPSGPGGNPDRGLQRLIQSRFLAGLPLETRYKLFGQMKGGQKQADARTIGYIYGQATDANKKQNRVGRAFEIGDAAGTITLSFDELGRTLQAKRTFRALATDTDRPVATTTQAFDLWGLPKSKKIAASVSSFPAKGAPAAERTFEENIEYRYALHGQPLSIAAWSGATRPDDPSLIVSDLSYDDRGNRIATRYMTGVVARQDYLRASNRLSSSRSSLGAEDGDVAQIYFQDLRYAYDAAGNVVAYENLPSLTGRCGPINGGCAAGEGVSDETAKMHGLLVRGSGHRHSYDQLNRIRTSAKTITSAFTNSKTDYEGEPQLLTPKEVDNSKLLRMAFNEQFAFDSTHELALIAQTETVSDPSTKKGKPSTSISIYQPEATPRHAPRKIETKLVEEERQRTTDFGYDAFGRMEANLCKHNKEPKWCWPDQYFVWNADDTLASQVVQISDERLPEKKKGKALVYYDRIESEFDHTGNRVYKNLSEEEWKKGGKKPEKTTFVSDTLYLDPNLTVVRRAGQRPEAIVHYFVGKERVASRWSEDERTFTYHAQLLTRNVTDIVVGKPGDSLGRIHSQEEYAAFGEVVHERELFLAGNVDGQTSGHVPGLPRFRFNAKEQDESGLQDFGARFYDNRLAIWIRPDPILASYLDGTPNGGAFAPRNLASYTFGHGNPIGNIDQDGNFADPISRAVGGAVIGGAITGGIELALQIDSGNFDARRLAGATAAGAVAGAITAATLNPQAGLTAGNAVAAGVWGSIGSLAGVAAETEITGEFTWEKAGLAVAGGAFGGVFGAASQKAVGSLLGRYGDDMVTVTTWIEKGLTGTNRPGSWVMRGGPSGVAKFVSGAEGKRLGEPTLKNLEPFTRQIRRDQIVDPMDWREQWKGMFGQGQIID